MIIGLIFAIVFGILLVKAIIETIHGLALIIWGLFLHAVALVLDIAAMIVRVGAWIVKKFKKKPRRRMTMAECIIVSCNPGSPDAKRILASLR